MRVLDVKNKAGRPEKNNANWRELLGKSSEQTAKLIGVSARTVERMRTILEYGTDEDIEVHIKVYYLLFFSF